MYKVEQLEHRDVANVGGYLYFPAGVAAVAIEQSQTEQETHSKKSCIEATLSEKQSDLAGDKEVRDRA